MAWQISLFSHAVTSNELSGYIWFAARFRPELGCHDPVRGESRMKHFPLILLLLMASSSASPQAQTAWDGFITDAHCGPTANEHHRGLPIAPV